MFWAIQQVIKQNAKIREEGRKDERRRLIQELLDQSVDLPPSFRKEAEELGLVPALAGQA